MHHGASPRHAPTTAPTHRRTLLAASLLGCAAAATAHSDTSRNVVVSTSERHYAVPLFLSANDPTRKGVLRIVNRSDRPGVVQLHAIDEAGVRFGPVELPMEPRAVRHVRSGDLEWGAADESLGIGAGQGDWRLELVTALDIAPLAYARSPAGAMANMDAVSTVNGGGFCEVAFFNPAGNQRRFSRLRLTNPGERTAEVTISGLDDQGLPAPAGDVRLAVAAGASRTVTARELESGASDLDGRLGDGAGRWRLSVSSNERLEVMNLLADPSGGLSTPSGCTEPGRLADVVVHPDHGEWGTDAYQPGDAGIVGDTLRVTVSYGGGCEDHGFTLVLADAFMMTDPPRLPATLAHQANNDPCEAWLTEELEFDLTPLKELHGGSGTVLLLLSFVDGTERELRYTF